LARTPHLAPTGCSGPIPSRRLGSSSRCAPRSPTSTTSTRHRLARVLAVGLDLLAVGGHAAEGVLCPLYARAGFVAGSGARTLCRTAAGSVSGA
jgi:hypothetical protein